MKNFKFKIEGNEYEVAVDKKDAKLAEVTVNGKTITVEVEGTTTAPPRVATPAARPAPSGTGRARAAAAPAAATPKVATSPNAVKAPIPGTVFKVPASVGTTVKKGDTLVVLEAMKMENNIEAVKDGVVKAVYVQVGQAVAKGEALVEVE